MPSVAQESPTLPSSKKRRRDDSTHQMPPYASLLAAFTPAGTDNPIPSSSGAHSPPRVLFPTRAFDSSDLHSHHLSPFPARKIVPLPSGKRQRTTVDIDAETDDEPMQRSPSGSPPQKHEPHHHQRQHPHPQTKSTSQTYPDAKTRPPTPTAAPGLMSRCHVCSRKPTKKSDLDSFADCQGCGQRTCYVCIRECLGWGPNIENSAAASASASASASAIPTPTLPTTPLEEGETSFTMLDADAEEADRPQKRQPEHGWTRGGGHRQVVCSGCCVERGQDGEVVCLGCLPFVEG